MPLQFLPRFPLPQPLHALCQTLHADSIHLHTLSTPIVYNPLYIAIQRASTSKVGAKRTTTEHQTSQQNDQRVFRIQHLFFFLLCVKALIYN